MNLSQLMKEDRRKSKKVEVNVEEEKEIEKQLEDLFTN